MQITSFKFLSFLLSIFYFVDVCGATYAEEEFEQAWNNPAYTQAELDDVNINEVLSEYYETPRPLSFNRQMLWDVETKKAWDPKTYIPYVVRDGNSWGREILDNGDEVFVRSSEQKQWLNSEIYEVVFEKVYLNHKDQKATFIGSKAENDSIQHQNQQPIFHVQHSIQGEENCPINVWRIVYLTEKKEPRFIEELQKRHDPTKLPGFVEIYIEKDLQIPLLHKKTEK